MLTIANQGGGGGQKSGLFANVVSERPLKRPRPFSRIPILPKFVTFSVFTQISGKFYLASLLDYSKYNTNL